MARKQKSATNSIIELVVIVAVAIGLALVIQALIVKPYKIPSESMVPTLEIGQRVLVNRIGTNFTDPKVGQVTVFNPPEGWGDLDSCGVTQKRGEPCSKPNNKKSGTNFIKRIVAGPGDKLSVKDGHVILNGKLQKEDFLKTPCINTPENENECDMPRTITVPKDHYFMMGDNRGNSRDSRFWGPVPKDWIIGDAFATYWPPDRIGLL